MIHILAFLIILIAKIIKWSLIKTRLFVIAIPAMVFSLFYNDWYELNIILVSIIGIVLTIAIIVSWVITLKKYIKTRKHNKELILNWTYEKYGTPLIITKNI